VSELYQIFDRIKELLYEKKFDKFELPELVEIILKEDKTNKEKEVLNNILIYIEQMEESLEDLGYIILDIAEFKKDIKLITIELKVRDIVLELDRFIDGFAAILRSVNFDESKLQLKQSLAYLKSLRNLLINNTNEYKLKIKKTELITETFIKFLTDIIDIFINKAYAIRILKIKEVLIKIDD